MLLWWSTSLPNPRTKQLQSFRVLRWLETSSHLHCLCVIVLLLSTHPHFLLLPTSPPHTSHPLFLLFLLSSSTLRRSQPAGMRQWSPLDNSARTKLTGELQDLTNQITIFTMYNVIYTNFSAHYFLRLKESPVHTINCFAQDDSPRYANCIP